MTTTHRESPRILPIAPDAQKPAKKTKTTGKPMPIAPTKQPAPAPKTDNEAALAAALDKAIAEITAAVPGVTKEQVRDALIQHFAPALRSLTASRVQGTPPDHAMALALIVQRDGPIPRGGPASLGLRSDASRDQALTAALTFGQGALDDH